MPMKKLWKGSTRLKSLLFIVILAGFAGLGFTAVLTAQMTAPAAPMARSVPDHFVYLTGNESVWSDFPKKPELGSAVDQADLVITLSAQATRTDAQKQEAQLDKDYSIKLVTNFIDPTFETDYPHVFQVLTQADGDGYLVNKVLKKANARLRPFAQHPILVQPLFPATDFSYPSGHATGSELQARILGTLFPAQAEALRNRARQVADSRVVAGVHYASDTEAGLTLGDLLFTELEATDKFKDDLSKAAELDKIGVK
jgi:acid phosphatase (class A)